MRRPTKDTHCSHCGSPFGATDEYPRRCNSCTRLTFANPTPVSVVLLPVDHDGRHGLLVIRRAIPPHVGRLALIGGFVDAGESWQRAAAREVREETGADVDAETLEPFWFTSTPDAESILLFALAQPIKHLPTFVANREVSERGLIFGPQGLEEIMAFPLHTEVATRYFSSRDCAAPHDYRAV